jgi:hypothetical protein
MREDRNRLTCAAWSCMRMWVKINCHGWAIAECMDVVVLSFDTFLLADVRLQGSNRIGGFSLDYHHQFSLFHIRAQTYLSIGERVPRQSDLDTISIIFITYFECVGVLETILVHVRYTLSRRSIGPHFYISVV